MRRLSAGLVKQAESNSFLIELNWYLLAFVLVTGFCGLVSAAKGRLVWFLVGLCFGGAIWPLTAFLTPTPRSPGRGRSGHERRGRVGQSSPAERTAGEARGTPARSGDAKLTAGDDFRPSL